MESYGQLKFFISKKLIPVFLSERNKDFFQCVSFFIFLIENWRF